MLNLATKSLHHELSVSLRPRDNDVHPNPHGLRRGGDHVVDPVVSLNAEGQGGIRTLRKATRGHRKGYREKISGQLL